jgi:pimeloyl-ACP methyl ester carboxylesterase
MTMLFLAGCTTIDRYGNSARTAGQLRMLNERLDEAEGRWKESLDDPWAEKELELHYHELQDVCSGLFRREGYFRTAAEKKLCEKVKYPYAIYFNDLLIEANRLKEQLFEIEKPGTVAHEYYKRPSSENLEKLHNVFEQVHRYFVGWPYTWSRYINKYLFQKSRLEHFGAAFIKRDREYRALEAKRAVDRDELRLARKRAEFAFHRLKEEYVTNDLPSAGEVNAFYMAGNLDEYHCLLAEEKSLDEKRKREGRRKEVVILVHGLSETRDTWGKFPELLAHEDLVNNEMKDIYFKVYVFSYDTVEDSKSVEGFKNELDGFISDIIRDEKVDQVHLIGHSFGAVLCLKYLIHEVEAFLEGGNPGDPARVAKVLVKAYEKGKIRSRVKSFISIAGSLSGSEVANIAGERFIPKERLYRKSLPLFQSGVPGYGDIQVRENQIGSNVNLESFRRLDVECPLSPQRLLQFLPEGEDRTGAATARALIGSDVPVLCVIGDPIKLQSVLRKEGLLKLGDIWEIFRFDGLRSVAESYRRKEDDGLVKSYSANINHSYLLEDGSDIGYKGAEIRYTSFAHFSICRVDSRSHPAYRYVVSFLNGALPPQMQEGRFEVRLFATLLRVFPEGFDPQSEAKMHFMPDERVVYDDEKRIDIPALKVEKVTAGEEPEGIGSRNVDLVNQQWNRMTGVLIGEGEVVDTTKPAWVTYRLSAMGYRERLVRVPVKPGEVSYVVNLVLEKE